MTASHGGNVLTVVCALHQTAVQNISPSYSLGVGGVPETVPFSDCKVMLADLNAHMDRGREAWIGVIGKNIMFELNQSGVFY